jgi:hypothetical protein
MSLLLGKRRKRGFGRILSSDSESDVPRSDQEVMLSEPSEIEVVLSSNDEEEDPIYKYMDELDHFFFMPLSMKTYSLEEQRYVVEQEQQRIEEAKTS